MPFYRCRNWSSETWSGWKGCEWLVQNSIQIILTLQFMLWKNCPQYKVSFNSSLKHTALHFWERSPFELADKKSNICEVFQWLCSWWVLEDRGPYARVCVQTDWRGKWLQMERLNMKENFFWWVCFACQALGYMLNDFLEDLLGMSLTSSISQNKKIQVH